MDTQSPKINMTVTRVFDAPVEQVWKAWSDPALVMRWWGPAGFTAPLARMEFREGGTSLVCMRTPDGHDLYNNWTYREIVPWQRITFVSTFADQDGINIHPSQAGLPEAIPPEVPHEVTFRALDANHTEVTVTEYGYPSEEVAALSRSGMEQCLDKMEKIF